MAVGWLGSWPALWNMSKRHGYKGIQHKARNRYGRKKGR